MCRLFTQGSHDLKADVPNRAVKTKRRAHIFSYAPVSAPISGWQMVWRHLQCFEIDVNNFTRINNTQCFHVFRSQARATLTPSKLQCCEFLALARRQRTNKNTYRPQMRINSDQNTQLGLFSVVRWVWQHPKSTKRQEQTNLSQSRRRGPAKPRMHTES